MSRYIYQKCHNCDGKGFTETADLARCSCWQLEHCYKCGNTGIVLGTYRNDCLVCSGTGKREKLNPNHDDSQPSPAKNNLGSNLIGYVLITFSVVGLIQWLWKSMGNYASLEPPYNYVAGWYNFFLREPLANFYNLLSYVFSTSWNNNFTALNWLNTVLALVMIGTFIVGVYHAMDLLISFLSRKIGKDRLQKITKYALLMVYVLPILVLIILLIFGAVMAVI